MAEAPVQSAQERATEKMTGIPIPAGGRPPAADVAGAAQALAPEQPELELGGQPLEGAEPDQAQPDSELEEIEFDGVKFALPREHVQKVKDALLRQSDYTTKTAEVAERSRVIAEQQRAFEAQSQFHTSSIDDIAQIRALDQAIAQYANVNWMAMQTDELMRTRLQYDQLKEARETAKQSLDKKWQAFNISQAESMKNLERAGRQEASRRIPGFGDKESKELTEYARKIGYPEQMISRFYFNPLDVEVIWKAKQFDALKASGSGAQQRANQAPPIVRPGGSQQQRTQGEKVLVQFQATKNPREKERIGSEILARKMGLTK